MSKSEEEDKIGAEGMTYEGGIVDSIIFEDCDVSIHEIWFDVPLIIYIDWLGLDVESHSSEFAQDDISLSEQVLDDRKVH